MDTGGGEGRRYIHSCQCPKQKSGKVITTNALDNRLIERKLLNKFSNNSFIRWGLRIPKIKKRNEKVLKFAF